MDERWLPVSGYEGIYEVSDLGRVRRITAHKKITASDLLRIRTMRQAGMTFASIAAMFGVTKHAIIVALRYPVTARTLRTVNRILANARSSHGYLTVMLCRDGKPKCTLIHRIVAAAFLGPCPAGYEVNHKNGNKADPNLSNLEYVTRSENAIHAHRVLGIPGTVNCGPANGCAKVSEAQVKEIRRLRDAGHTFSSLGKQFGVTRDAIYRIAHRLNWKHVA